MSSAIGRVCDSLALARSALVDAKTRLTDVPHGAQRSELESRIAEMESSLAELIRSMEAWS